MLFNKLLAAVIPELTPVVAQAIYESLKITNNKEGTIATGLFFPEHVIDTNNEITALESVAHAAMMRVGKDVLVATGEDPKTMEPIYTTITIPPAPTTQVEFEEELSSDLLDIPTFAHDYMDYILMYKADTTWIEFEEQFLYLKQQENELGI